MRVLSRQSKVLIAFLFINLFGVFQIVMQNAVGIMASDLKRHLNVDAALISILSSSFFYSYILMQIPAGIIYDRYGIRSVSSFSLLLVGFSCLASSTAQTVEMAILWRVLLGGACATGFIGILVACKRWFSARRLALIIALTESFCMLGVAGVNTLLSELVITWGWARAYVCCGVFALLLASLTWISADPAFDLEENQVPKSQQASAKDILTQLIGSKDIWLGGTSGGFVFALVSVFAALWAVPFVMVQHQLDLFLATSVVSMIYVGIGIASPFVGWLANRYDCKTIMLWGTLLCVGINLALLFVTVLPLWILYLWMFLLGLCCSVYQLAFTLVSLTISPAIQGAAMGMTNMLIMAFAPFLQVVIGFLLSMQTGSGAVGTQAQMSVDYRNALLVLPLGLVCSIFVILYLIRTSSSHNQQQLPAKS